MNVVHVGDGRRRSDWIAIVARHPDAKSVATVGGGTVEGVPGHPSLAQALAETQVDAAILTDGAARDGAKVTEALENGLAVILDRPHVSDLDALTRLARLARARQRPLALARDDPGAPRLKPHLRKVGMVSHVSLIDRRPLAADAAVADPRHAQLVAAALDHFESARRLFDLDPVRLMARCGTAPWGGATTLAFLELEADVHVHYYGSALSGRAESSVWVEGAGGSLREDGPGIWWRKRRWPRFAPWRWQLFPGADEKQRRAEGARAVLSGVARALSGEPAAAKAATLPLALLGAALESDRRNAVIDIGGWPAASPAAVAA